ncbi:putative uncharacterized protein [Eubacterium sp. CAG:252]|jgi:hypothetical protein|uniref:hypothetical protein n=1 Tax=Lachnospira sp. TaxID=2049031 RepID=UPI00033508D4|nr:putative uncharacterized protein [Eubacterium sp. CAG:252]
MATSSITKSFVITGREQVEMFTNAIEASYQESLTRTENDVKYRELKDPVEINNFMKKWKEQNE